MKILYRKGDLLSHRDPEGDYRTYFLHIANNKGVMGSGVAKQIVTKYPSVKEDYLYYFQTEGEKILGKVFLTTDPQTQHNIYTCVAQNGYGRDGKKYVDYHVLKGCLKEVQSHFSVNDDVFKPQIAMPKIGAGLGGGDWSVISQIIEKEFRTITPILYAL